MDDDSTQWNAQWLQWYHKFLQQRAQAYGQQLQALHGMQPWQQPPGSRFQNPLVGADAPLSGDRITDPAAGTFPFLMGGSSNSAFGDPGEGGVAGNPMLMQMLGFGGY